MLSFTNGKKIATQVIDRIRSNKLMIKKQKNNNKQIKLKKIITITLKKNQLLSKKIERFQQYEKREILSEKTMFFTRKGKND